MSSQSKSKKIAINTAVLYLRMFAILIINLFAVRLVLRALGAEDYGIYNVVAGIVAIVGFVRTSMAAATQRFYSYAIGENDENRQREVFTASFRIFLLFSVIAILIAEVVGLWLINNKLIIPVDRLLAAKWVFHFSIISFVATIMCTPFSAAIIAKENMGVYAAISFGECLLKFLSAVVLYYITVDKLFVYGFAIMLSHVLTVAVYITVAMRKYSSMCSFISINDTDIYKSIVSFSGWSLFGAAAGVLINQGNTLLVNIFFGPIVNAARAIALQISSSLIMFSGSFTTALRPPIVKSYAEGNDIYLNKLFGFGNKFIYYAMLIVSLPLFFEMETVLSIWLKEYDLDTVLFSRLIIIYTIIMVLHYPITAIIQATGAIKKYYLFTELFTILCMPATYIAYKLGATAYATFVIMCIAILCSHITRLIVLKKQYPSFDVTAYLKEFVLRAIIITAGASVMAFLLDKFMEPSLYRLIISIIISICLIGFFVYTMALDKNEKEMIVDFVRSFINKSKKQ